MAGVAGSACAANWEIAPRLQAGYRYSDNYRLGVPGTEIEVSGGEADAQVAFRTVDPRTQIEIVPRINATYFPNQTSENSNDYFLTANFADVTPRRRVGINSDFSRETVVRSELPTGDTGGGLGNPTTIDSGRVLQRNRRNFVHVEPFFSYDMTQRQRLELNAHYVRADFDDQLTGAQQDVSDAGAGVGFGFLYSQRSSITLRATASRYKTDFDTDAYGGQVEWSTQFTPNSRMYIMAGAQQTKPENGSSDTNVIAGIGGQWSSPRNSLFLDLTRSVGPVAAGTVVERHQLRVQLNHAVSPRVSLLLSARGAKDEEIGGGGGFPTRKYAAAEGGVEWRMLRNLAVTATYNYRWQEYADEPSDRSGNGFLVGVVYEPKRRD